MTLGFVSAILPDLSLEEVLAFAKASGYGAVELMCWPKGKAERRYAGVTHVDTADFGPKDAARVKALAKRNGVTISALGYYPNPLVPDEREARVYLEHIQKTITAAGRLGIGRMNTFVGRDPARSLDDNWAVFKERWPAIIRHAEREGVNVGIENCPMWFTADEWPGGKNLATSPRNWRRMFELIPSKRFGLNYDPSHLVWQHMDYLKPIREFADRIVHVHLKDVRVDRDRLDDVGIMANPLEYHVPKLPGLGEIDWGRFFSVLTDAGYDGPCCVEVEDRAYEGSLERRKDALRQARRFLESYLG
jgi:sugar phosphate isomerase/epimerase